MRTQQFEAYAAEAGVDPVIDWGPRATAAVISGMEDWVNAVRDTDWFRTNFPNVRYIEVHPRHGSRTASVGGYIQEDETVIVEMLGVHCNALYLCHEVAHGLARARYDNRSHDPWWARIYLEMVYLLIGPDTYAALRDAFERGGIDHDPGPEFTALPDHVRMA